MKIETIAIALAMLFVLSLVFGFVLGMP